MSKWYFTFGFGQPHQNGFHVIESDSFGDAREQMMDKFGTVWAFQYDEKQWIVDGVTQQEKFNLHEVK